MPKQPTRFRPHSRRGGVLKKLLLTLAALFTLVIVLLGVEALIAVTSSPSITDNYAQQRHDATLERQRARAGDGLNQWPRFQDVFLKVDQGMEELERINSNASSGSTDNPWSYVEFSVVRGPGSQNSHRVTADAPRLYEQARESAIDALEHWRDIGVFDAASVLPGIERSALPPTDGPMMHMLLPELGKTRQLARAQAARMRLAAEAGDDAQRLAAFEETLALARITADTGPLIAWLTGIAIEALALNELVEGLFHHPPAEAAFFDAAGEIIERESLGAFPAMAVIIENERLDQLDVVQRSYTRGGRFVPLAHARLLYAYDISDAPGDLLPLGETAWSNIHARLFIGKREAVDWVERSTQLAIAAANATGQAIPQADAALAAHGDSQDWTNPIYAVSPNLDRSIETDRRRRIMIAGTRVMLAIERFRYNNDGAVPSSLNDLGDLLPDDLPTDPVTGQPWLYEPAPTTTDWKGNPLDPHQAPWPYTLRSGPLPGLRRDMGPYASHPSYGVLITQPVPVVRFER